MNRNLENILYNVNEDSIEELAQLVARPQLAKAAKSLVVDVLRAVMVVLAKNTDVMTINETLQSRDFLSMLRRVSPGAITQAQLLALSSITRARCFNIMTLSSVSKAAYHLCDWVIAVSAQARELAVNRKYATMLGKRGLAHAGQAVVTEQLAAVFPKDEERGQAIQAQTHYLESQRKLKEQRVRKWTERNALKDMMTSPGLLCLGPRLPHQVGRQRNISAQRPARPSRVSETEKPSCRLRRPSSSANLHPHMKDMSDIMVAVREHQRKLQMLRDQEAKKKQDKVDHFLNFTKSIKTDAGKLSLTQLQRLSSTYKAHYYDMVLEEFDEVQDACQDAQIQASERTDVVASLVWAIEDTVSSYDEMMADINRALLKRTEEAGLMKRKCSTRVEEFGITDMFGQMSSCHNCWNGLRCQEHKFQKKEQVGEDRELELQRKKILDQLKAQLDGQRGAGL